MSHGSGVATIGLVLHPTKPVDESLATITAWSRLHTVTVLAREEDAGRVPAGVEVVPDADFGHRVGGVVALGGDGTMLGAMRLVVERPVPVLGVNHGNLGFLVEVTPGSLGPALDRLGGGDFTVEQHGCLVADAAGVELNTRFGFNDVVLARLGRTGALSVDLTVNDLRYGYYRCDAVVISTPSGSTAYNYAAGGPVVRLSAGEHASRSRIKLSLLDLPLRRDQLLELIPAELRENAEFSVRRAAGEPPG